MSKKERETALRLFNPENLDGIKKAFDVAYKDISATAHDSLGGLVGSRIYVGSMMLDEDFEDTSIDPESEIEGSSE